MESINDTAFKCKICNAIMEFNIDKDSSFHSKTEKKVFFGMQLTTYRVYHEANSERHHNAILVDHEGAYRGHVDAYSEQIDQIGNESADQFWMLTKEEPLLNHTEFGIFIFFDRDERWVLDTVCPSNIKPIEIVKRILIKIQEASSIYDAIPDNLTIPIADMVFEIYHNANQFVILTRVQGTNSKDYSILMETILNYKFGHRKGLPRSKAFKTCFKLLEIAEPSSELLLRLLTDEIMQTPIFVPLANNFPVAMVELQKEFKFPEEVFSHLLFGRTTVLDLLNSPEYLARAEEIIAIVDFGKKITELQHQQGLSSSPEIQRAVRDLLTKFKVVAELDKGIAPKKLADIIFTKEFKSKDAEFVNRMIAEMVLQTIQNDHLKEKIHELIDILQNKKLKQAKKVSKAIF